MPSPSPSPTPDTTSLPQTPSMEEVWNDIKLSSLSHYSSNLYAFSSPSSSSSSTSHSALRSFILHEFMSPGIAHSRSPPAPTCLPNSSTHDSAFLASLQLHHQPTLLTLISASDSHKHPQQYSRLHALDSSASPTNKKARCDPYQPTDRRYKRMMKNRESAARSRARKQAYKSELEIELANLREENARLRKQQEQLCFMPLDQLPKNRTLHRTSTAPF